MSRKSYEAFLDAPMNPELVRSGDELAMQRATLEQAKTYIDAVGYGLPWLMGDAVAAFNAAERNVLEIDSLLASPRARSLRDEFGLSDVQDAFAERMADLVIAVAKHGPGYHY
ncbi:MAG: hypothetical protein JWO78_1912 [Micavibrio sp.]|nr:hypothetical protein [Micavibrio sp.]